MRFELLAERVDLLALNGLGRFGGLGQGTLAFVQGFLLRGEFLLQRNERLPFGGGFRSGAFPFRFDTLEHRAFAFLDDLARITDKLCNLLFTIPDLLFNQGLDLLRRHLYRRRLCRMLIAGFFRLGSHLLFGHRLEFVFGLGRHNFCGCGGWSGGRFDGLQEREPVRFVGSRFGRFRRHGRPLFGRSDGFIQLESARLGGRAPWGRLAGWRLRLCPRRGPGGGGRLLLRGSGRPGRPFDLAAHHPFNLFLDGGDFGVHLGRSLFPNLLSRNRLGLFSAG